MYICVCVSIVRLAKFYFLEKYIVEFLQQWSFRQMELFFIELSSVYGKLMGNAKQIIQ